MTDDLFAGAKQYLADPNSHQRPSDADYHINQMRTIAENTFASQPIKSEALALLAKLETMRRERTRPRR